MEVLTKPEETAQAATVPTPADTANPADTDESGIFTRRMAALYNTTAHDKDRVLELRYTDIGKTYQISLTKDGATVPTNEAAEAAEAAKPDTVIETPFALWKAIAAGEVNGSAALACGKYRVTGDFSLMLNWNAYFGAGGATSDTPSVFAKRAARVINVNVACAAMGAAFLICGASGLYIAALELVMAVFWGVTVFMRVPVTCYFSAAAYGGEKMLQNPLFTRTNRILTAVWATEFLCMAVMFVVCRAYGVSPVVTVVASNAAAPLLGIFTAWFQKWYPAKMARG